MLNVVCGDDTIFLAVRDLGTASSWLQTLLLLSVGHSSHSCEQQPFSFVTESLKKQPQTCVQVYNPKLCVAVEFTRCVQFAFKSKTYIIKKLWLVN